MDFHFINSPIAACPYDTLKYTVNDVGADHYYWKIPSYLGTYIVDEKYFAGVKIQGTWTYQMRDQSIYGNYRVASNNRNDNRIIYSPNLPFDGMYKVFISYFVQDGNKSDVPVTVKSLSGNTRLYVNQTIEPEDGNWHYLGNFPFARGNSGSVTVSTDGSGNQMTIADGVRFEITSFNDDTSITLLARFGLDSVICVEAQFQGCNAKIEACSKPINIGGKLNKPVFLEEEDSVCQGVSYVYKVENNGASNFVWNLPDGASILNQTGTVITNFPDVRIKMNQESEFPIRIGIYTSMARCNMSSDWSFTEPISFNGIDCPLADPVFELNAKELCSGASFLFKVEPNEKAEYYEWVLPKGLREKTTNNTGTILKKDGEILVEPIGNLIGKTDKIRVRALSSRKHPSIFTETNDSIEIIDIPEFSTEYSNLTSCEIKNGSITLKGLNHNIIYSLNYMLDEKPFSFSTILSDANGSIILNHLQSGNYSNITVSKHSCNKSNATLIVLSEPQPVKIDTILLVKEIDCDQYGNMEIKLRNELPNSNFFVDFEDDGIIDRNSSLSDNKLTINNLPIGTKIQNLSLINAETKCKTNSNFTSEVHLKPLEKNMVHCVTEHTILIPWNVKLMQYRFTKDDEKIIPTITDKCLLSRSKIEFALYPFIWNDVKDFDNYPMPVRDNIVSWKILDNTGNTVDCETHLNFEIDLTAPSAFSPNNDGINDSWQIEFLIDYPKSYVAVFNRLGIKVFESKNGYPTPWDGKYLGSLVPVDTYYYIISLGERSKVIKGTLSVFY